MCKLDLLDEDMVVQWPNILNLDLFIVPHYQTTKSQIFPNGEYLHPDENINVA